MIDSARLLLIGVGNDFRRDDGAGRIVARKVKATAGIAVRVIEASGLNQASSLLCSVIPGLVPGIPGSAGTVLTG